MSDTPELNPVLHSFWHTRARNRILYGGRASSKSWDAAGFAVYLACNFKMRFLCARQFQNNIDESVYTLLKLQIERFGLTAQFRILERKIIHKVTGAEFIFYGLWRNINEIKSLEGIDICWIEEAHNLTSEQWEVLEPTLRKAYSQFWIIFNPKLATDFVYQRFVVKPPANSVVRLINYTENPFLSETMLEIIEAMRLEDEEQYNHIYLGVPRDDDEDSVIKRSWIMASIDAHKTLGIENTGSKRLGFDVADGGADLNALVAAHGSLAFWCEFWKGQEDELLKSTTRVWVKARELKAKVIYDSIGVGAMAGAKLGELNADMPINERPGVEYSKFNAGGGVWRPERVYAQGTKNKDMFSNLKAQAWWSVADRFRATYNFVKHGTPAPYEDMIFIDSSMPHLEALITELATPKRDFDNAGRVKVESKKDLKKREIASPNLADAFVMAFAIGTFSMNIDPEQIKGL